MESEEFCLRWNNHHNVLVTVLDKLLEKESLVDVTLASEGQFLRVHRLVLCACSQYFEEMLSYQSDKHAIIFLKDVKFVDLKALVDYMYKGEVNVAQDQLSSFLNTAEALNVKGLAYKDDASESTLPSKSRSSHSHSNFKHFNNRKPSEFLPDPAVPVIQMPEASPPIPNPIPSETVKSTKGSAAVKSHSNSVVIPSNDNVESNDNFVVLDPKIESEMNTDHNEDRSEGKFPNWTARDCDDDWSTSDPGLMVIPNPDSSVPIPTFPSAELWSAADNIAGPSSVKPKTSNTSSSTTARGVFSMKCPICGRCYTHPNSFHRHRNYECPGVEPRFPCLNCGARFRRKQYLRDHHCQIRTNRPPV